MAFVEVTLAFQGHQNAHQYYNKVIVINVVSFISEVKFDLGGHFEATLVYGVTALLCVPSRAVQWRRLAAGTRTGRPASSRARAPPGTEKPDAKMEILTTIQLIISKLAMYSSIPHI